MANLLGASQAPPSPRLSAWPISLSACSVLYPQPARKQNDSLESRATTWDVRRADRHRRAGKWHAFALLSSLLFSLLSSRTSTPVVIDLAPAAAWPSRDSCRGEKRSESDTSYVPSAGERILRAMLNRRQAGQGPLMDTALRPEGHRYHAAKNYRLAS